MSIEKLVPAVALVGAMGAAACASEPPPPPEPVVQVDTVVVTREVEVPPPLPEGEPRTVCLASGQAVQIMISPQGDTLVGPQRTAVNELRPVLDFEGNYAEGKAWFVEDEAITFENRRFQKFGTPTSKRCPELKIVGEHMGVNLFADVSATSPFDMVYVPAAPGVFQPYQAQVGRVRG